ncbi:MAG: hypothetical protein ABEJ66_03545, partial [Candidatus Nanohaloarchaea archaeon]
VKPGENAELRRYVIPVTASKDGKILDIDYFYLDVKKGEFRSELSILEAPRSIQVKTGEEQVIPILVKNTGRTPLENVSAELQNAADCGKVSVETVDSLAINETASVTIDLSAASESERCSTTLIMSTGEGAYSFSKMDITLVPEEGVIPPRQRPPLLAMIWTFILVAYSLIRKRFSPDSSAAKIPLILLVMGETVILLYLVVNHYALVSAPFLPF